MLPQTRLALNTSPTPYAHCVHSPVEYPPPFHARPPVLTSLESLPASFYPPPFSPAPSPCSLDCARTFDILAEACLQRPRILDGESDKDDVENDRDRRLTPCELVPFLTSGQSPTDMHPSGGRWLQPYNSARMAHKPGSAWTSK